MCATNVDNQFWSSSLTRSSRVKKHSSRGSSVQISAVKVVERVEGNIRRKAQGFEKNVVEVWISIKGSTIMMVNCPVYMFRTFRPCQYDTPSFRIFYILLSRSMGFSSLSLPFQAFIGMLWYSSPWVMSSFILIESRMISYRPITHFLQKVNTVELCIHLYNDMSMVNP